MDHYTDIGWLTLYILYIRTLHTLLNDEPSNVQSTVQQSIEYSTVMTHIICLVYISILQCCMQVVECCCCKHKTKYKYKEIETPTQFQILRNIARGIIDLFLCIWDNNVWREYNVVKPSQTGPSIACSIQPGRASRCNGTQCLSLINI